MLLSVVQAFSLERGSRWAKTFIQEPPFFSESFPPALADGAGGGCGLPLEAPPTAAAEESGWYGREEGGRALIGAAGDGMRDGTIAGGADMALPRLRDRRSSANPAAP